MLTHEDKIRCAVRAIEYQCGDVGKLHYRGVDVMDLPHASLAKLAAYLFARMCRAEGNKGAPSPQESCPGAPA